MDQAVRTSTTRKATWRGPRDAKQLLRLHRLYATAIASVCQVAIVIAGFLLGLVDPSVALTGAGAIISCMVAFYAIFRSGLNRRFHDPSLTEAQILSAVLTMQYLYFNALSCRQAFMLAIPGALAFGVYRLRHDAYLRIAAVAMATHETAAWWIASVRPGTIDPVAELLTWLALGVMFVTLSFNFGSITRVWVRAEREKQVAEVTLRSIADAVISSDRDGNVRFMNPAAEALTGWTSEEAGGKPLQEILQFVAEQDEDRPAADDERAGTAAAAAHGDSSGTLTSRRGSEHLIESRASKLTRPDGTPFGSVVVFRDVTQTRELLRRIGWDASHDALTGLTNRREFEAIATALAEEARTSGQTHAMLYIDLDRFKIVNDSCGHPAGDKLLRQLAERLRPQTRPGDILARLGGDEFGMILCATDPGTAQVRARAIIECVEGFRFVHGERVFRVGASIGIAAITPTEQDIGTVMAAADAACYLAKENGRGRSQIFDPSLGELANRREDTDWVARLIRCLEEDRFFLYQQRIVPIANRSARPERHELLLRKRAVDGRIVAPGAFLPAAERHGLMARIDRCVVAKAFELMRRADAQAASSGELGRHCSINLSGASLGDPGFAEFVLSHRERSGILARRICFEVKESAAIADLPRAARLIDELRAHGYQFALDDFGSGSGSFTYLDELAVDYVKIDGRITRDIATNPVHRAIVQAIQQVARVIGIETVAKCVEDEATLACLREMGLDYAQGFALHRPEPAIGNDGTIARSDAGGSDTVEAEVVSG